MQQVIRLKNSNAIGHRDRQSLTNNLVEEGVLVLKRGLSVQGVLLEAVRLVKEVEKNTQVWTKPPPELSLYFSDIQLEASHVDCKFFVDWPNMHLSSTDICRGPYHFTRASRSACIFRALLLVDTPQNNFVSEKARLGSLPYLAGPLHMAGTTMNLGQTLEGPHLPHGPH